jgi:hypothetical protein
MRALAAALLPLALAAPAPAAAPAPRAPTGLFGLTVGDGFAEKAAQAGRDGFGLAVIGAYAEHLDALRAAGMKGVVGLWVDAQAAKSGDPAAWRRETARVSRSVARLKGHPALYAWYVADEPDGEGMPPARLMELRGVIRALDPTTPLMAVFDEPRRWSAYLPAVDIVCVDPYLRRRALRRGYASTAVVTDWLRAAKRDIAASGATKTLCAVLGAFELRPKDPKEPPGYRKPTPAEFADMAGRAAAEGSGLTLAYSYAIEGGSGEEGWRLPADDPALWAAVKAALGAPRDARP